MTLTLTVTRSPDWRSRRAALATGSFPWGGVARWFSVGPWSVLVRVVK